MSTGDSGGISRRSMLLLTTSAAASCATGCERRAHASPSQQTPSAQTVLKRFLKRVRSILGMMDRRSAPSSTSSASPPTSRIRITFHRKTASPHSIRTGRSGPQHPEWQRNESFTALLAGDFDALKNSAETDWAKIVDATHGGLSIEAFAQLASQWLKTAKHPRFKRLYTQLVYQPMLEVMDYLRTNGFKTYIVTGGGQDFVRGYAQSVYGVPSEQVIGSFMGTTHKYVNGKPTLTRLSAFLQR